MFYKVMKGDRVVDVLDNVIYLKWQPKHKIMVLSDENEAQAILLSDKETICHEETLYNIPVEVADKYEIVRLVPIDAFEYKQLKMLYGETPESIIDAFVISLLESNII